MLDAMTPDAGAPAGPQMFRWQLAGGTGPALPAGLLFGQGLRQMVMRLAAASGMPRLPDGFHRDSGPLHQHAFYLPEDADEDGRIDHAIVFAEGGLPAGLVPILAQGGNISLPDLGSWHLVPDSMGSRGYGGLFGPACRWLGGSPYVTPLPRHRAARRIGEARRERPDRGLEAQLRRELDRRQLPQPIAVLWHEHVPLPNGGSVPVADWMFHAGGNSPPRDAAAACPELLFGEPVRGPLALGFGAHFGLGLMRPIE